MAKIINQDQQIILGAKSPRSLYSRVVGCNAPMGGGPFSTYSYTVVVGQQVRLLNVTVKGFIMKGGAFESVEFGVHTMLTEPQSPADVLGADCVVPCYGLTGLAYWLGLAESFTYSWDMNKLFTGSGRRFAFWANNNSPNDGALFASFQISEG